VKSCEPSPTCPIGKSARSADSRSLRRPIVPATIMFRRSHVVEAKLIHCLFAIREKTACPLALTVAIS
jgi:hypothetical protein